MAYNKRKIGDSKSVREIITEQFLNALDQGKIPWRMPWSRVRPQNVDGRQYTGINYLLLSLQEYADPRYITKKRIDEMGGMIRKGEHGHIVAYYTNYSKKVTKDDEEVEEQKRILRYYRVWNVTQCDGLKLKPLNIEPRQHEPVETAQRIIDDWYNKPTVIHAATDRAAYNWADDKITVPLPGMFDSTEEYYSTVFHEMIHSTGHKNRLGRLSDEFHNGLDGRNREELTAEIGAAFLLAEAGIDSPEVMENSTAYIQGWGAALREDPSMIMWAAAKAGQAANLILNEQKHEADEVEEVELALA